jgi:hypothetical protein
MSHLTLTPKRQGAWIINTSKHLINFAPTNIAFSSLESLFFAGKCGSLLIKLSADETEQLNYKKVRAHAQVSGISGLELKVCLETLRTFGCLDWDKTGKIFEVLPFSRERVLETTYTIFDISVDSTNLERSIPFLLEFCLLRPRLESEVKEFLTQTQLLPEAESEQLLGIVHHFGLLGVEIVLEKYERLFYNEYQFAENDKAAKIGTALSALPKGRRDELNLLLEEVSSKPGILPESLSTSEETKTFAIGMGLVEESIVTSPAGNAKFLTLPRLPLPSVGSEAANLEDDIFHHSKMLLSSLRFGELRSQSGRGRIQDPFILVNTLLERDRIGPCTAIGEDYTILETEGVIKTIHADHKPGNQFYMELRRREPAEVVLSLLEAGSSGVVDSSQAFKDIELPLQYTAPEVTRPVAARQAAKQSPELIKKLLEAIRT